MVDIDELPEDKQIDDFTNIIGMFAGDVLQGFGREQTGRGVIILVIKLLHITNVLV